MEKKSSHNFSFIHKRVFFFFGLLLLLLLNLGTFEWLVSYIFKNPFDIPMPHLCVETNGHVIQVWVIDSYLIHMGVIDDYLIHRGVTDDYLIHVRGNWWLFHSYGGNRIHMRVIDSYLIHMKVTEDYLIHMGVMDSHPYEGN